MARSTGFWVLAVILGFLLAAASAPSPLYSVYAAKWGFSPITLTVVFAVYALALLVALLMTGRMSDGLGRRPVLTAGLLVQAAGMAVFIAAHGVAALYVARVLQGVGTGVATGALGA